MGTARETDKVLVLIRYAGIFQLTGFLLSRE